jgi:hypothetical protein
LKADPPIISSTLAAPSCHWFLAAYHLLELQALKTSLAKPLKFNEPNRVCLKMGYTPNYSHLVGIMIINHWV